MTSTAVRGHTADGSEGPATPARYDPAARSHRYAPMAAVAIAAFGAFLAFMDSTIVNVAFPNIQAAFPHSRFGVLTWVLNGYNVVFAGLMVLAGLVADLVGRRRVFQSGLILFVVMSAACGAATSVPLLIVFRVLQGAGAAMLVPASLGIVVHASPQEHRAHALSIWAAAAALAAGLGPPIGGALVDAANWRLVFLVNVPLGLAGWALARRAVIESRAPGRRVMPDLRGALLLSLGLAALTLGIVQGSTWGWSSPSTITAFAAALVAFAFTAYSSRHHLQPILDPRLLKIRGFAVSNLITLAAGTGLYAYLLSHILWLHYIWGYSLLRAGLSVAPGAVVTAVVALPIGRLADRVGARAVVVPGALLWAGAFAWYGTQVGVHPDFVGQWLPGQILSGIGVAATLPVAATGGLSTVPAGRYATASAVNATVRQIGGVLGIALLTVLLAHPTPATLASDLRHGWDMAGWCFVAAAVFATFFGRIRMGEETDDASLRAPVLAAEPEIEAPGAPAEESGVLAGLSGEARRQLMAATDLVDLAAGSVLFRAGDDGDSLYLLEAGRLQLRLPDGSSRDVYPGTAIGELALLTDAPRSATVVARRDSRLRRLDRAQFERIAEERPEVMAAFARDVARKLQLSRPAEGDRRQTPKVIAVVSLDDGVDTIGVASILQTSLARTGDVARLDKPTPDALQRAEGQHDLVLLVGGPDESERLAVMRQADRVVMVTSRPDAVPVPGLEVPHDVVVCGRQPSGEQLRRWHEVTGCRRVYHAGAERAGWEGALRPLVARLSGRSIGLVLAGGGARALAHLGVLHVLEESGVVVDRVAGTSMGALIAAAYGTGATAAEVDQMVFDGLVVGQPFRDWTISRHSLARGERGKTMLRQWFGDARLEALARETVVVSTDLYARQPVYHRTGPAVDVVAASVALPVLFPPQRLGEKVHVDGSLTDNCPVGAFADLPEGPVLAVRIGTASATPRVERIPSLGDTLLRVMLMGEKVTGATEGSTATLAVTPDTRGVGLLEFHQIDVAREAGRQAAEAALAALGWP